MNRLEMFTCVAIGLAVFSGSARAVPVDGSLDPDYGAALSTQTTQTSLGDWPIDSFSGSELDEAFGYVADDILHLLITGSFNRYDAEFIVYPNQLQLYIDVDPGGQNMLSGANPSVGGSLNLQSMTGLTFDADFSPDYWLAGARESSSPPSTFYTYYAELPTGGGGAGYYLGSTSAGGPGTLSGAGASNPFGILASIDVSNEAGVTGGCGASSGAAVTTGIEWAIPLAAIGNSSGLIRICAMLVSPRLSQISNQVLGPVPPGTCALGSPSGVDFGNVPGSQYFVIGGATPTRKATWGRLKAAYR